MGSLDHTYKFIQNVQLNLVSSTSQTLISSHYVYAHNHDESYNCVMQVKLVVKEDGSKWCYHAVERVIHRKGWKENTAGSGSKRAVTDGQFEDMCSQLKDCGWECTLSEKEKKSMVKDSVLPKKLAEKTKLCQTVRASFTIDIATDMKVQPTQFMHHGKVVIQSL